MLIPYILEYINAIFYNSRMSHLDKVYQVKLVNQVVLFFITFG